MVRVKVMPKKLSKKEAVAKVNSGGRATTRTKTRRNLSDGLNPKAVVRELQRLFDVLGVTEKQPGMWVGRPSSADDAHSGKLSHAFLIGDLLTEWSRNPNYLDKHGNPLPLRLKGTRRSFTKLTLRCAPNINARRILLDLRRIGAVRVEKTGLIYQVDRSISAYEDKKLAAQHTLATLREFIQTLRHNLSSNSASNSDQLFHRIAWNRDFDPDDLPRLKIWLRNHGQHFLESADNWMSRNADMQSKHTARRKKGVQVSVGIYLAVGNPRTRTS